MGYFFIMPSLKNLPQVMMSVINKPLLLHLRLKRSSSQEAIDELGKEGGNSNFKRGGVRATAGPRLGWGAQRPSGRLGSTEEPRTPFKEWTAQQVC